MAEIANSRIEGDLLRIKTQLMASLEEVQTIVAALPTECKERRPHKVVEVVSEEFGLSVNQLYARDRRPKIALTRHIAQHILHQLTEWSYLSIGQATGVSNPTTVMHAIRKIDEMRKQNKRFDDQVRILIGKCLGEKAEDLAQ